MLIVEIILYFMIGSGLYWHIVDDIGDSINQNSISGKLFMLSVFFIWPIWISLTTLVIVVKTIFVLVAILFSPLIKIIFNVDIFEKYGK